jgi:nicotinamidase-related amidase
MERETTAHMNPDDTALIIIDVQQGLFKKSTPLYQASELLEKINLLTDKAHQQGIPVIYVQHSDEKGLIKGSLDWQLHPGLHPQRIDTIIHKQFGNAFENTNLGEILQSLNITHLVVTGVVTHGCVKATCLGARQLGYRVTLVEDGHSSYSKDAARLIMEWNEKLKAQGCELKAAEEIQFRRI